MERLELLGSAWLAILLSAVVAWMWGFLSWTALGLHKKDFQGVPFEDDLMSFLRQRALKPGRYFFPFAGDCKQNDPAFVAKWKEGPTGQVQVWSDVNMGRNMALTFVVHLAVSFVLAYLAAMTLDRGAPFLRVFQVVGTGGVLAYCFAFLPNAIWFQGGVRATTVSVIDGVVIGLGIGAVFGALWPS